MNRTVWIFRFVALAVFLILTLLMMNLYTKLHRMSAERPTTPAPAPRTPSQP